MRKQIWRTFRKHIWTALFIAAMAGVFIILEAALTIPSGPGQ